MNRLSHSALRLVAFAAALSWAVLPIAATVHADAHAHVYCAQHQRIEESSASSGDAAASAGLDEADEASAQPRHVACAFPVFSARSAFSLRPPTPTATVSEQAHSVSFAATARLQSLDVLSRAPKASPPVA